MIHALAYVLAYLEWFAAAFIILTGVAIIVFMFRDIYD